jgi:hypothetical protein
MAKEKFMLIFQGGMPSDQSPEEMQENMGKWMAWIEKLKSNGQYHSGEPLLPGGKLISGKNKIVTDGPYTEGKELVGGFFIVNANDYDEAVKICDGYPDFGTGGSIQLRQVMKIEM